MAVQRLKRLELAKSKMMMLHIFFASLMCSTPTSEDNSLSTAATDGRQIFYNDQFIEGLDFAVVIFVLAHELGHIIFFHMMRKGSRNAVLWNIACDHVINLWLKECGFTLWPQCYANERFAGMSEEQVYDVLLKEHEERNKQRRACGDEEMTPEEEAGDKDSGGPDGPGGSGQPMVGDILDPGELTDEAKAATKREVQARVSIAITQQRNSGKVPDAIERAVKSVLEPQVPWYDELREYLTKVIYDDENWSRRNRRFTNVYLPRRWQQAMGEFLVIGDTSGSMTQKDMDLVASEINSAKLTMNPSGIRVIWADAKACNFEEYFEPEDDLVLHPKGGGGTDMRLPLMYAEQFDPEVVVLITDGETPWPKEEPPYNLIVLCTTNAKVPVGRVLRVHTYAGSA